MLLKSKFCNAVQSKFPIYICLATNTFASVQRAPSGNVVRVSVKHSYPLQLSPQECSTEHCSEYACS